MNGYYKLVIDILRLHSYDLLRQGKGAHEIWTNAARETKPFQKTCPPEPWRT